MKTYSEMKNRHKKLFIYLDHIVCIIMFLIFFMMSLFEEGKEYALWLTCCTGALIFMLLTIWTGIRLYYERKNDNLYNRR